VGSVAFLCSAGATILGRRRSGGSSESGEGGGESGGRRIVECNVVLAASQILHEGVAAMATWVV
jgi:hypothetical protein